MQESDLVERERPNSSLSINVGDFNLSVDEWTPDGRDGRTSPTSQVLRDFLWEPLSIDSTDDDDLPKSNRHRRRDRDQRMKRMDNKGTSERSSARRKKGEGNFLEPLSYDYEKERHRNSGRAEMPRRHRYDRHAYPEHKRDNSSYDGL